MLLRVPGIGQTCVQKIVTARRHSTLDFEALKKMRVVLKRAKFFITCNGRTYDRARFTPETLAPKLRDGTDSGYIQQSLADAA
jgi:predicted DNA-binding helix-hairpin-helix protein